jgi:hypothetical protein
MVKTTALTLTLSPREREQQSFVAACSGFIPAVAARWKFRAGNGQTM